jgi:hypothetical protein
MEKKAIHFKVCFIPPFSSLKIEVMCNRQQPAAPNNHKVSLILKE